MENHDQTVNAAKFNKKGTSTHLKGKQRHQNRQELRTRYESRNRSNSREDDGKCRNCGGPYPHKDSCPAKNKKCKSCGKLNHFARVCRTNPPESAKHVTFEDTAENDEYVYTVGGDKQQTCKVKIDGKKMEMMVDPGASVNLMDERTYRELYKRKVPEANKRRIFSYGSPTPLPVLGTIEAEIFVNTNSTWSTLLPAKALQEFSWVLTMLQNLACSRSSTKSNLTRPVPSHPLLGDLESLFGGISKVKGKVIKLHIDPDVIFKQQPHRRISFQVRKDVEMELKRLEELDIIETVTGPTPWVSLIVIVPKRSGQVRICVDMREANKAVKHLMPTIDDLVADLNGATVFSKLDLSSGYHQLEQAPESRCITTFSTHVGLRRYKRLMFGINAAPEILQNAIEEILTGLPGCKSISDDITVYGKTQKKHDENLRGVLKRLQQHGVRLKKKYAPSRGVRSSSTDRFSARTESRQTQPEDQGDMDMSKPESVSEVVSTGEGSLHPRLGHDNCSFTAVNQRHGSGPTNSNERSTSWKITWPRITWSDVILQPKTQTEVIVDASPVGLGGLLV